MLVLALLCKALKFWRTQLWLEQQRKLLPDEDVYVASFQQAFREEKCYLFLKSGYSCRRDYRAAVANGSKASVCHVGREPVEHQGMQNKISERQPFKSPILAS